MQDKSKIFFPNLDGLRFISFMLVFLSHSMGQLIEDHATGNPLIDQPLLFIFGNGKMGVSVFFVLSGFLITYLILSEIDAFGKIDIKSFYIRRTLRIWPLYFAVLIFGFVLFPYLQSFLGSTQNDDSSAIYYFTFLSNFDVIRLQQSHLYQNLFLAVTWSIAIEEQFYLVWPLLFFSVPRRFYSYLFYVILIISIIFMTVFIHNAEVLNFHTLSAIFDLGTGGLIAYYSLHSGRFRKFFENLSSSTVFVIYLVGILLLAYRHIIFDFEYGFLSKKVISVFFFAFIIMDQNFNLRTRFKFSRSAFMSKWGKYTYGLYLLHPIALLVVSKLFLVMHLHTETAFITILNAITSLLIVFILAWLSYHYFEKYFLRYKTKFSYFSKE